MSRVATKFKIWPRELSFRKKGFKFLPFTRRIEQAEIEILCRVSRALSSVYLDSNLDEDDIEGALFNGNHPDIRRDSTQRLMQTN